MTYFLSYHQTADSHPTKINTVVTMCICVWSLSGVQAGSVFVTGGIMWLSLIKIVHSTTNSGDTADANLKL